MKMETMLAIHSSQPVAEAPPSHVPSQSVPSSQMETQSPSPGKSSESLERALELRKQRRQQRQAERNQRRFSLLSGTPSPPGSPDSLSPSRTSLSRSGSPIGPLPGCSSGSSYRQSTNCRSPRITESNGREPLRPSRGLFPKSVSTPDSTSVGCPTEPRLGPHHLSLRHGALSPSNHSSSAPSSPTPSQRAPSRLGRSVYGDSTPPSPSSPSSPWSGAQVGLMGLERSHRWNSPVSASPRFASPLSQNRGRTLPQSVILSGAGSASAGTSSRPWPTSPSKVPTLLPPGSHRSASGPVTKPELEIFCKSERKGPADKVKLSGALSTSAPDLGSPTQHQGDKARERHEPGVRGDVEGFPCPPALELRRSGSATSLAELARELIRLERKAISANDGIGMPEAPLLRPELGHLVIGMDGQMDGQMDGLDCASNGGRDSTASTPGVSHSRMQGAVHRRAGSVDTIGVLQIAPPTHEDGWSKYGLSWRRRGGAGQEKWNSGLWISAVKRRIEKIEREEREKRVARVFAELQAAQARVRRRAPDHLVKVQMAQKDVDADKEQTVAGTVTSTSVKAKAVGCDEGRSHNIEERCSEHLPRPTFFAWSQESKDGMSASSTMSACTATSAIPSTSDGGAMSATAFAPAGMCTDPLELLISRHQELGQKRPSFSEWS